MTGTRRVRFQLAPKPGEIFAKVVELVSVLRSPDLGEQLLLADEFAGMPQQDLQDLPLGRGQPDIPAVSAGVGSLAGRVGGSAAARRPPGGEVDRVRADPDDGDVVVTSPAPADRPQPSEQFIDAERFGDVVIRPGIQGLHLVTAAGTSGKHDDRHSRPATQPPDHLDTVHIGQPEVEDDDVGYVRRGVGQGVPAVGRRADVVAAGGQIDPQRPQELRFVVDDEDPAHRGPSVGDRSPGSSSSQWATPGGNPLWSRSPLLAPPLARPTCEADSASPSRDGGGSRGAAGSATTMVSPPPGVSSGRRVPPIDCTSPRHSASPRPTPVVLSRSPSRWNGAKTRSRSASGIPGPRSTTRSWIRSPSALAAISGGRSAGE